VANLLRHENGSQPPITLHVVRDGHSAEVGVAGELDLASVPELRACLLGLITDGCDDLVVSLDGVEFCDSSALGVFVGCHRRLGAANGRFELRRPPPVIRHLFAVSGLDQILTVTD
jgi:anti-sigma B factor antagonist